MFWNKKTRLPISDDDKVWVDQNINWLWMKFGNQHAINIKTITPTKDFYDRTFDGSKQDAEFILEKTKTLMNIKSTNIKLDFFLDSPVEMADGTILTTPADIDGSWESAAGVFERSESETIISIETQQLKNPISLIATIAHELAHQILLVEHEVEENDEYLTDLTAIVYGFGIFMSNSRFNFSSFSANGNYGWQSSGQGYLPEQIIAYTMSKLSIMRNEKTDYSKFMKKSVRKYFDQSLKWLIENEKQ